MTGFNSFRLIRGCLLIALGFSLTPLARAQRAADKPLSAFETLKIARRQLGKFGKDFMSMETENAKLTPRYWWIRFYDESLFMKVRAVQMIGPEMMKNLEPANPFDGGNRDYVIPADALKYDSDKCIRFIEKAAKDNQIPLHSLNIKLDKPHPGESNPIWEYVWFDDKGKKLGKLSISATTGKVTEIVSLKIHDRRFAPVSRPGTAEKVEETFIGVGADLEEFFTGKRTVDKNTAD